MAIQRFIKRDDIIEGQYIPTSPIEDYIWTGLSGDTADWLPNPALMSPLTTKGDLLGFNTADDRFPVGVDGYEIVADSTVPLGVKWQYKANLQKEVTGSTYTVLITDDRYTIFFNRATAITVTVDSLALNNIEVDFYNYGAGAVTFVQGSTTLSSPDGVTLLQYKVCALFKFMANNIFILKGELI